MNDKMWILMKVKQWWFDERWNVANFVNGLTSTFDNQIKKPNNA